MKMQENSKAVSLADELEKLIVKAESQDVGANGALALLSYKVVKDKDAILTALRGRDAVLEEAAIKADGFFSGPTGKYDFGYTDEKAAADDMALNIACAIRALKEPA